MRGQGLKVKHRENLLGHKGTLLPFVSGTFSSHFRAKSQSRLPISSFSKEAKHYVYNMASAPSPAPCSEAVVSVWWVSVWRKAYLPSYFPTDEKVQRDSQGSAAGFGAQQEEKPGPPGGAAARRSERG